MSFKCFFCDVGFTDFRPLTHHIISGWIEDFTIEEGKI